MEEIKQVASFDWSTLIPAISAFIGIGVGGFVTWKIQARQLKHADENRFQEHKKEAYLSFLSAMNELSAYVSTHQKADNTLLRKLIGAYEEVSLIAEKNVKEEANKYYNYLFEVLYSENNDLKNVTKENAKYRKSFLKIAREDLKIDKQ